MLNNPEESKLSSLSHTNSCKFDIAPIRDNALTCYEELIASVCKWLGRDYELMFTRSLAFFFTPAQEGTLKSIGGRIERRWNEQLEDLLNYHGVWMQRKIYDADLDQLEFISKELENGCPILVFYQAFWLPWDPGYQRKGHEGIHTFLIVGCSTENNCLYCVDSTYMKSWEPISLELFMKGSVKVGNSIEYYTFSVAENEKKHFTWLEILQRMLECVQNNKQGKSFNGLKLFCDELEKNLDFRTETDGYHEFFRAPLFYNIQQLALGRRKASRTLQYLAKHFGVTELVNLAREFDLEGSNWENVRAMLIKMYVMPNEALFRKTITRIREAIDKEQELVRQLLEIYRSSEYKAENRPNLLLTNINNQAITGEVVFIDLCKLFNNNACGSREFHNCVANFNGLGQFFLLESMPSEGLIEIGEMKFWFPELSDITNDNIGASGETIPILTDYYRSIMFLGNADEGNVSGPVIIQYENNVQELIHIEFTCWWMLPGFGETVAWSGKMAERIGEEVFVSVSPVRLFAQKYPLQNNKKIISIQLPDCINIHIFAISLEK